jgi:hypothetical protein
MADSVVSSPYRWAARFLNWREPVPALRQARKALSHQINGHNAMNNLVHADSSFPAWLTLSSVWEESMDDEIFAASGRSADFPGEAWPSSLKRVRLRFGKSRTGGFCPPLA